MNEQQEKKQNNNTDRQNQHNNSNNNNNNNNSNNNPQSKDNEKKEEEKEYKEEENEENPQRRRKHKTNSSFRPSYQNNTTDYSDNSAARISTADTLKNITIKFPAPVKKIMYFSLVFVALFGLMIFAVLFSDENASISGSAGSYVYGRTCTKITVINTDCDSNNQNCTNKYNGDIETEDYIAGVVAAESKGNTNTEYLKLLSVAARSNLIENVGDSCTVEGNSNFQNYMDVNSSSNSSQVKQAVSDTKNFITISNNNVVEMEYGYGNIVNEDTTNYYISYGKYALGNEQLQTIPKSWADNQNMFKNYLTNWKSSPETTTELSLIGALYLISNAGYTYQDVVEYYYGSDVEISENTMILSGINGFMNPTRKIYCTSPYGTRIHPVKKTESFHGGLDIGISGGEPIYAAKDGVVSTAVTNVSSINDCKYSYGNYVIIDHGDGSKTLYSHMKYGSVPSNIYVGAEVRQGEQVGAVGSTGCSTGNHLHYEVRINDERVDPADYLDLTDAKGTCRK